MSERNSLSDRLRQSVAAQAKSTNSPPVVFREQKRPKFIVRKSPAGLNHDASIGSGSPNAPREPFLRKPKFMTASSGTPDVEHHTSRRPAFVLPQKRAQEVDIAQEEDGEGDSLVESVHNPFNVSDEVDEPIVPAPTQRTHVSKRIMTAIPGSGRPMSGGGTQNRRPTSEVLSSLKFGSMATASRSASPVVQTSADWSPHKRRGKAALERDKFLPGGMAETVALWIYEKQSRDNRREAGRGG